MSYPLSTASFMSGGRDITFVDSAVGGNATGADFTITFPTGVQPGDCVLVWVRDTKNTATFLDTGGYTRIHPTAFGDIALYRKIMGSTPDTSIQIDGNLDSSYANLAIVYILRGVDPSTPEDATTVEGSLVTNTTPDSPSITTVTPNAMVLSLVLSLANDAAVTGPSGYTNVVNHNVGAAVGNGTIGVASKIVSTPAAENPPSWSNFDNANNLGFTAALRAA